MSSNEGIRIDQASALRDIESVKSLFREYESLIGFPLDFQGFKAELATLPGSYAPPLGRLLLARFRENPSGCVALRPFSQGICEMKRLFVRHDYRCTGLGRKLCRLIISEARYVGYSAMRLDTIESMVLAVKLYESLGFKEIPAYRKNPIRGARFFELQL